MNTRYVVTGATGHVGKLIASRLVEQKQEVRAVGRDRSRLQPLVDQGAEPWVGDLEDADFVKRVCTGAQALFAMIPPNMVPGFRAYQNRVADNFVSAIKAGGISHVVTLSSIGADLEHGNGPVGGLYDLEQRLNGLDQVNLLHLRPGYFMENTLMLAPMIKHTGTIVAALAPTTKVSMIATRDIGAVGARRLGARDFVGHTVLELQGPEDVTMQQLAHAYGEAIGKPDLKYVQVGYDVAKQGMLQMGLPEEIVDLYMEMYRGLNDGTVRATQQRSPKTTTPTTLHEFAKVFAQVYQAG